MENAGYKGDNPFDFRTGRPTTETCVGVNQGKFPNPHGGLEPTLKFFKDEFGLDADGAVVLLGAHSLGATHTEFSGFNGPWDRTEEALDTGYYKSLVRAVVDEWPQVDNTPEQHPSLPVHT